MPSLVKSDYRVLSLPRQGVGLLALLLICLFFWSAAGASLPDKKQLDWLETFLKEYSEAAGSMCQDGKYFGCEVADSAQAALQALKTARAECKSGNKSSCDRVARIVPQIAAQTADVCPEFQLKDCPKVPGLTSGPEDSSTGPPAGYFEYQGEQLPGYVPSTQR
jgi:hypothetical protein